jgi:hypothetical protein
MNRTNLTNISARSNDPNDFCQFPPLSICRTWGTIIHLLWTPVDLRMDSLDLINQLTSIRSKVILIEIWFDSLEGNYSPSSFSEEDIPQRGSNMTAFLNNITVGISCLIFRFDRYQLVEESDLIFLAGLFDELLLLSYRFDQLCKSDIGTNSVSSGNAIYLDTPD